MRDIKFRAKRIDNGEWVYGYYFVTPLTDEATNSKPEDGWYFLSGRIRHCIAQNGCVFEIAPETVGQSTGIFDLKGTPVYEGDILSYYEFLTKKYRNYEIVWDEYSSTYVLRYDKYVFSAHSMAVEKMAKVVGDIYNNPELVGVLQDARA